MKTCSRCKKEKALSEFQVRRASKDGLASACRTCLCAYDRERANQPHRVEMRLAYQKTEGGKQRSDKAKREWRIKNQDRRAAHVLAGNAIRAGKLIPEPCWICGEKAEMHHSAYDYPLAVSWLCPKHHAQLHKEHRQRLRELKNV